MVKVGHAGIANSLAEFAAKSRGNTCFPKEHCNLWL